MAIAIIKLDMCEDSEKHILYTTSNNIFVDIQYIILQLH